MPDLRPGLPEEVRERLIALADAGEHVWQAVAAITLDLLAQPGVQRLRLYADVGACLGMQSAGVRAWCGVYQAVGDDLLVEFPQFRFTHWRVLVAAANRLKRALVDLTLAAAASADNYGGLPVPPDVLAVQLGSPGMTARPWSRPWNGPGRRSSPRSGTVRQPRCCANWTGWP